MADMKRDAFNAAVTARLNIARLTLERNKALAERDEARVEVSELRRQNEPQE